MQHNDDKITRPLTRPRLGRTHFVEIQSTQNTTGVPLTTNNLHTDLNDDAAGQLLFSTESLPQTPLPSTERSGIWQMPYQALHPGREGPETQTGELFDKQTAHLLQLSGMMRAVRSPGPNATTTQMEQAEDGYWPLGIQQVGPLPVFHLYGRTPIGRSMPPAVSVVMPEVMTDELAKAQPVWMKIPALPLFKLSLGLFIGLDLLFIISRFVNLPLAWQIVQTHLTTPPDIALGLLAGVLYLSGNALRGLRWMLFLNAIGDVSLLKSLELSQVAPLLNFLLPLRTGEAASCLMLKQTAQLPVSRSLPTVAIDKSLEIVAALLIIALMPLLGIKMDLQLWLVFGLFCSFFLLLLACSVLSIWQGSRAVEQGQKIPGWLPIALGSRIEQLLSGFVDALLAGVRRPLIFLPALLLSCLALVCNALFLVVIFDMLGSSIAFGAALCGYAISLSGSLLPAPPGQVGNYEVVALLVFSALLGLPDTEVLAVFLFAHLWTAVLLVITGLSCLKLRGLSLARVLP